MPFDAGRLAIVSQKGLTRKEKILLNIFLLGGFYEPVPMRYLVNRVYLGKNYFGWGLFKEEYKSKYGSIWRDCKILQTKGYLEKYNNPVRWKLKYNKTVAKKLVYIIRKLGFPKANIRDFGFS